MGIEFMSDAKKLEKAGSMKEDKMPKGFVIFFAQSPGFLLLTWLPVLKISALVYSFN